MQFLIDIGLSILYFCIFLLLCAWSWRFWVMYIQQKHLTGLNWVMLEIKLPREIYKSPLAAEMAISSLLINSGISTKFHQFFNGALPVYSSLEIASIEGVIHFYVRAQRKFKPLIESSFYSQYPGIEIVEADDYTKNIRYHHLSKEVSIWGITFRTGKTWTPINEKTGEPFGKKEASVTMEADFLPIKTYVDYGLDKDPKEEFKTDPLTMLLEMMGGLGKGEQMWYQILIQDESVYNDKKLSKFYINKENHQHMSLIDMVKGYKKQIRTSHYVHEGEKSIDEFGVTKKIDGEPDAEGKPTKVDATYLTTKAISKKEMDLTQDEKDEMEAINKKISKQLALCVLRLVYITKKENFNAQRIPSTISFPRAFKGVNFLYPKNTTDPYDYPWQDVGKKHSYWRAEEMFEEYVEREGFFPHAGKRESLQRSEDLFFWSSSMKQRKLFRLMYEAIFYPFDHPRAETAFTLNLEEIATLWHLPGTTAATPTLPRIDSNKGVAPSNLPI